MVRARDPRLYIRLSVLTALFLRSFLGVLIVLFSKCMIALFIPVNRRGEGIKWGLVSYTVVMFLSVTVHTAINGHILSISYIDNRDFPDDGPYGYRQNISSTVIVVIPRAAFRLNNWAADGLLVSSLFNSVIAGKVPNVGVSSSSIVATCSTL